MQFEIDLDRARKTWPGGPAIERAEDLFSVAVSVGSYTETLPTHLFPGPIRVIPYDDPVGQRSSGVDPRVPLGTQALATHFQPGELGIALKHRRPGNRVLDETVLMGAAAKLADHVKLHDRHVAAVVPISTPDGHRVVFVQSPADYPADFFYAADYPTIFFRLHLKPWVVNQNVRRWFMRTIRSMLVCFDLVTQQAVDFDEQPLATDSPEAVRRYLIRMIEALAGNAEDREWFKQQENWVYCSQLLHVSVSAALLFPLSDARGRHLVGDGTWRRFKAAVAAHNSRSTTALARERPEHHHLLNIPIDLAPNSLRPVAKYASPECQDAILDSLAFRPLTLVEVIFQFMMMHFRRSNDRPDVPLLEASLLRQLLPAFRMHTGLVGEEELDPPAAALLEYAVRVVGGWYRDEAHFLKELAPVERAIDEFVRLHGELLLYIPPELFHLVAQQRITSDLIDLEYVGHGVDSSLVRVVPEPLAS